MADKRTITTHSNYTIKKKHKDLNDYTIYERDYMTTSNLGGYDSYSIPWGEGNFKIKYNDNDNKKTKHKYGNWLINENCDQSDGESCEYFTLKNLNSSSENISSESKIELKPNKSNLLDYVYFGSCEQMIKASVEDIIVKFPAELYISENNYIYYNIDGETQYLGGKDFVVVDNPFNIDIISSQMSYDDIHDVYHNPMRFFSESSTKYTIIDDLGNYHCVTSWEVDIRDKKCPINGDILSTITLNKGEKSEIIIKEYYYDGNKILLTNSKYSKYHIRPTEAAINNFFNDIDDFERFLLNRDSNPLYTITIDVPEEDDYGVSYTKKSFTWYVTDGWNIDINSNLFGKYYNDLLSVARWYDENKTDNLWRNMTHDSIKNMDRTHVDLYNNEDNDDYKIGTSRLRGLFYAYGRLFDDIKRYINNIKTINTITYNGDNNTPDYFLTDQLNLSGWEVKSAVETLNKDTQTNKIFLGSNKRYTVNDANLFFERALKINSRAILSRKGTKAAVEMVLSLFGLCSYDWAKRYYDCKPDNLKNKMGTLIVSWDNLSEKSKKELYDYSLEEYVSVVKNTIEDVVYEDETLPIEEYNSYKKDFPQLNEFTIEEDTTYGLPIRVVTVTMIEDNVPVTKKYLIPWFSKAEKYDGGMYFQMYGGWGKSLKKDVKPNKELYPNVNEIISTSGFTIYDETKKYLNIVDKISDLKKIKYSELTNGDIYYVNDINDFETYFNEPITGATNYFMLEDKEFSNIISSNSSGQTGWVNISKETLSCEKGANDTAFKVIYLESLIDDSKGNNQHVGYGKYDSGKDYLDRFRQIFKGAIENDLFGDNAYDCETGEIIDEIKNAGFKVNDDVVDNMKVWYFTDTTQEQMPKLTKKTTIAYDDEDMDEYEIPCGYEESYTDKVNVGKIAYKNNEVGFKSDLSAYNLENQMENSNDEAAANSIINNKKLVLKFNDKYTLKPQFKNYLYTVILPYVKQVIPSTTIFEVILDNTEVDFACFNFGEIVGVSK